MAVASGTSVVLRGASHKESPPLLYAETEGAELGVFLASFLRVGRLRPASSRGPQFPLIRIIFPGHPPIAACTACFECFGDWAPFLQGIPVIILFRISLYLLLASFFRAPVPFISQ